jgi:hypothetical protein
MFQSSPLHASLIMLQLILRVGTVWASYFLSYCGGVSGRVDKRIASHTSYLTIHTSHVTRHTQHLTPHTSQLTRHTSHLTRNTSHLTPHTSHLTPHTSHLTPHTSHLTPHTSHLTPHEQHLTPRSSHTTPHTTPRRCNASPAGLTPCGWSARASRTTLFTPTASGQQLHSCTLALSFTVHTGT